MVKESTFWAAELSLSLVIMVRNLRPQFHLKSHGASFCVVCKTRMMRWENKNEIIEKNQKESNKKKIKVILKNTLLELGGSCGLVTVIRPLVSEKREMDQLTCRLYEHQGISYSIVSSFLPAQTGGISTWVPPGVRLPF